MQPHRLGRSPTVVDFVAAGSGAAATTELRSAPVGLVAVQQWLVLLVQVPIELPPKIWTELPVCSDGAKSRYRADIGEGSDRIVGKLGPGEQNARDRSHDGGGISIFGSQGEGFARSQFPQVLGERTIIAASLGKGFGASGGVLMLGMANHEALFRQYSISYAFSAAPNLAAVGAALGSFKIHRSAELGQRQRRLTQRTDLFDDRIATAEGNSLPIRAITVGSETTAIAVAKEVLICGFVVTCFPTAGEGQAGIRVCITADHEIRHIEQLCDGLLEKIVEITGKPRAKTKCSEPVVAAGQTRESLPSPNFVAGRLNRLHIPALTASDSFRVGIPHPSTTRAFFRRRRGAQHYNANITLCIRDYQFQ